MTNALEVIPQQIKESNLNLFIEPIYYKKKGLIHWIKHKLFLRKLDNLHPGFDVLWQIADFIKLLERVYMYDNSKLGNKLSSSIKYNNNENGFVINCNDYEVIIKLFLDTRETAVEILRFKGNKIKSSYLFDENTVIPDIESEQILVFIIELIMTSVKALFIEYYDKKLG